MTLFRLSNPMKEAAENMKDARLNAELILGLVIDRNNTAMGRKGPSEFQKILDAQIRRGDRPVGYDPAEESRKAFGL